MDSFMMDKWNERVGQHDTVYVIGDLMFRAAKNPTEYLSNLKGRKHLIAGNHDKSWMNKVDMDAFFESVSLMQTISDGSHKITLCHYPMMTWNGVRRGAYHIYGHIHNNTGDFYWPLLFKMPQALNAGVEINNYTPVTLAEMIENNRAFKESLDTT
jgi:calcineurin-like phosphoesterase family protein